jgi:hypothetical protein
MTGPLLLTRVVVFFWLLLVVVGVAFAALSRGSS